MLRSLILLALLPGTASARQQRSPAVAPVTGTYRQPGCSLEVAPVASDSVRLQIECNRGAPTYNLGFLDERLPIRSGVVVYENSEESGSCRISIRFAGDRAIVTEDGTDLTCGFGAGVTVRGTYRRVSRRPPPFDLNPCG